MNGYVLIIRSELSLVWSRLRRGDRRFLASILFRLIIVAGLMAVMASGARTVLGAVHVAAGDQPQLVRMLELSLLATWAVVVVSLIVINALNSTYSTLYTAEETSFLMAFPLSGSAVLGARLTASLAGYLTIALPAFGPYVAYGVSHAAGWHYYVLSAFAFGAFLLLLVVAAALFVTLVMAYVPGVVLKRWFVILGLLLGLVIVFASQYAVTAVDGQGGLVDLLHRLGSMNGSAVPLLPHLWFALAVYSSAAGDTARALGYTSLLLAVATTLSVVLVMGGGRAYVLGWAGGQVKPRRHEHRRGVRTPAGGPAAKRSRIQTGRTATANPFWGLARKDCLIAFRTPIQWYLVLVGLVLVGFQIVNLTRSSAGLPTSAGEIERTRSLLLGFAIGGPAIAASAFAGSSFSGEGDNFDLVRSWPIASRVLFLAKAFATLPVPLLAALAATFALTRLVDLAWSPALWYAPVIILTLLPMQAAMALVDLYFPDFASGNEGDAPSRPTAAAMVKRLVSLYGGIGVVAALLVSYSFGGYYRETGWAWAASMSPLQARLTGYIAFLVEAGGLVALTTWLGTRRLAALTRHGVRGR